MLTDGIIVVCPLYVSVSASAFVYVFRMPVSVCESHAHELINGLVVGGRQNAAGSEPGRLVHQYSDPLQGQQIRSQALYLHTRCCCT